MASVSYTFQIIAILAIIFAIFSSSGQIVSGTPVKDQISEVSDYRPYLAYARNPDFFNRLSLRQWAPVEYEQYEGPVQKRNNAELVNHIVKNFHALGRLEDIGK
uniref:Uncharacterized protein n=1 Tax=Parastrongyloides trichosuri TaxID=131310 RepID=A0A0N4Z5D9_PARTI